MRFIWVIAVIFALLSVVGLAMAAGGAFNTTGNIGNGGTLANSEGWYDSTGVLKVYSNGTLATSDMGSIHYNAVRVAAPDIVFATWTNSSGIYNLYDTNGGSNANTSYDSSFSLTGALGVVGMSTALLALAAVVGIQIFGTSITETSSSALLKCGFFLTLWLMLSTIPYALLNTIPIFGGVLFWLMSLFYMLGMVNSIGHPSGGD